MSIAFDLFCLTVLLAIPLAQMLSVCNGVGGCWCPSSISVVRKVHASWALWNSAAISASAADATTILRMMLVTCIAPFVWTVLGCWESDDRKNKPPALDLDSVSDR